MFIINSFLGEYLYGIYKKKDGKSFLTSFFAKLRI